MNRIFRKLVAAVAAIATGLSTAAASAQTITYFHNDVAGSPVAATNSAGDLVWKEGYTPYGMKTVQSAAAESNRIGYTGKPYDADLDVSYMGARYYSPTYGRFLGMDPVEFNPNNIHSFNRYAYANNNPFKFSDPDGRSAVLLVVGLTGLAVVGAAQYNVNPGAKQSADQAARAVSAAVQKLGNWLRAEAAEGADNKGQQGERDKQRFFDKDQKDRARDRSRDKDGDPTCEYCGVKTTNQPGSKNSSQIDHIDAWSKGGRTSDENAANSCASCNGSKGAKELGTEWLPGGVKP